MLNPLLEDTKGFLASDDLRCIQLDDPSAAIRVWRVMVPSAAKWNIILHQFPLYHIKLHHVTSTWLTRGCTFYILHSWEALAVRWGDGKWFTMNQWNKMKQYRKIQKLDASDQAHGFASDGVISESLRRTTLPNEDFVILEPSVFVISSNQLGARLAISLHFDDNCFSSTPKRAYARGLNAFELQGPLPYFTIFLWRNGQLPYLEWHSTGFFRNYMNTIEHIIKKILYTYVHMRSF